MTTETQAPEGALAVAARKALGVLQVLEFTDPQPTFSSGAWIKAGAPAAIDALAAALVAQPQAAPEPVTFDAAGFRAWVLANLPDDTIIGSSAWWADHLTAWAGRFVKTAPVQAPAEAQGSALLPLIERLEDAASAALTQACNSGKVAHKAGIYMPAIETGAELARAIIALRDFAASQAQPKGTAPKLDDIEQYRMQMAGISTAALGYWKEGDGIHPDYDTVPLRDVAKLYAKYDALYKAAQAPAPAPEGYKLVPVEATTAMLDAARKACDGRIYPQDMRHGPRAMMADRWAAMLAAAPAGPSPAPEESPCACWPGRMCSRSEACAQSVRQAPAVGAVAVVEPTGSGNGEAMLLKVLPVGTLLYATVPADTQDAARYRWLRDISVPPHNFYLSVPVEFDGVRYTRQEVDAGIDAAIAASRPPVQPQGGADV